MARKKKPKNEPKKYQLVIEMPVSNGRALAAFVKVLDEGGNVCASDKANLDSAANRAKVGRAIARQLKDGDKQKWIGAVDDKYNAVLFEQHRAAAAAAGAPSAAPSNSRPSFAAEDDDTPRPEATDLGNSLRLVASHGNDLRHSGAWKRWIVWNGRHWQIDDSASAARRAEQTVLDLLASAKRAIRAIQQQTEN
jgi:hypothetical protein